MNQHFHWCYRTSVALLALFGAAAYLFAGSESQREQIDWTKRIHALGGGFPGETPIIFGEHKISRPDRYEYGATFSPDGELFFFGIDLGRRAEIHVAEWDAGKWIGSEVFLADESASYNDPMMSADGERLYFITDQDSGDGSFDIAFVERSESGWSGVRLATGISTAASEYFWSESLSGEEYFARNVAQRGAGQNFDIFCHNEATPAVGVALSADINSPYYEGDPFVTTDGRTLLFVSNRPGGAGRGDLYVSFRTPGGNWQPAIPLDSRINTSAHELTPYITPDGEWLLFSRDGDFYWVSTSMIESLENL